MSDKQPLCKLCKERHWSSESHRYSLEIVTESVTCPNCELLMAEVAMLKRELAKRNETVTHREIVTESVTQPETVTTVTVGRGHRVYASGAARQKAYRERQK